MKFVLTLALIASASLAYAQSDAPSSNQSNQPTPVLTFGVVPQQSAATLARLWGPLLSEVGKASGVNIRFTTATTIPIFEDRVAQGEYDVAYMNPYHFTVFNEKPGYKAIAKADNKRIKGLLVVRKDSPIQNIRELEGSTLAFPAPKAFAATLLTQAHLRTEKVAFKPKYVSSHDSVYKSVALGLYPAGGGIVRTLNNMAPDVKDQLRIFWLSEGFTPHAIAVNPNLDPTLAKKLQKALFELADSERGRKLLSQLKIDSFGSATDSDWDDVRALGIQLIEEER